MLMVGLTNEYYRIVHIHDFVHATLYSAALRAILAHQMAYEEHCVFLFGLRPS
jgi:hypothetical protein